MWTESDRVGTHTAHSVATGRCAEPAERDAPRAIFPQVLRILKLHTRVVTSKVRNKSTGEIHDELQYEQVEIDSVTDS